MNKNRKFFDKANIIDKKLEKYPILIFMTNPLRYGFRTITPLVIGTSNTKICKFLIYSAISTTICAGIYCSPGYLFGELIKSKLNHNEHIGKYFIGIFLLFAICFILIKTFKNRKEKTKLVPETVIYEKENPQSGE